MTSQRIALKTNESLPKKAVHLLPCRIHYTGPAPVSTHFTSEELVQTNEDKTEAPAGINDERVAYFRGRKMLGRAIELPANHNGTIYAPGATQTVTTATAVRNNGGEEMEDVGELQEEEMEELSEWTPTVSFDTLIEYGNNEAPDNKLLEWIHLAKAIHGGA